MLYILTTGKLQRYVTLESEVKFDPVSSINAD